MGGFSLSLVELKCSVSSLKRWKLLLQPYLFVKIRHFKWEGENCALLGLTNKDSDKHHHKKRFTFSLIIIYTSELSNPCLCMSRRLATTLKVHVWRLRGWWRGSDLQKRTSKPRAASQWRDICTYRRNVREASFTHNLLSSSHLSCTQSNTTLTH